MLTYNQESIFDTMKTLFFFFSVQTRLQIYNGLNETAENKWTLNWKVIGGICSTSPNLVAKVPRKYLINLPQFVTFFFVLFLYHHDVRSEYRIPNDFLIFSPFLQTEKMRIKTFSVSLERFFSNQSILLDENRFKISCHMIELTHQGESPK